MKRLFAATTASLALAGGLLAMPLVAQAPSLAMLGQLQTGQWELRFRDGSQNQKICVRNGRELIQIRHRGKDCSRYVVEDGAQQVTVQYTCKGDGYGRTSIRKEDARLVQISGQGIEGSRPFQFAAEARRIGNCN